MPTIRQMEIKIRAIDQHRHICVCMVEITEFYALAMLAVEYSRMLETYPLWYVKTVYSFEHICV